MTSATPSTTLEVDEPVGLMLSIDEIEPFAKDPRQSPNTEFDRIKASIHAHGLDQPLVVTRRPGTAQYLIAAGGNTRLRILRELLHETGDLRFARVICVFKPWRGESEVMLAHLRENDLRGGLTFLDKACAIREIRQMLEGEQGQVSLTQSALTRLLRERGYALSQPTLSHLEYASDFLEPLLPIALRAGLGRKEVERIRAFESVARALWKDRILADTAESYDEVLAVLCRRYDSADWDFLSLRQALESEIAERLNQTVHAVRLALDARLCGVVEDALPKRNEDDEWWPEPVVRKPRLQSEPARKNADHADSVEPDLQREAGVGEDPAQIDSTLSASVDPVAVPRGTTTQGTPRAELPALRTEIAAVATGLAARHGLGELIVTIGDLGTGFLVVDVPEPALLEQFDESGLAQISMIWWQLMALAEMTVAPISNLLPHLSPKSVLYRALREQDAGLLFNAVWTLDPGQIGFRLWRTVGEQDWSDLRTLMSCYRSLHAVAAASNVGLWGSP